MHTSLAPLAAALLAVAVPPPLPQTTTVRTEGDQTVIEVGGRTLQRWLDDFKHPDASVRAEAIEKVAQFGKDASRAVPHIVERLQDADSSPRIKAAVALGTIEIRKEDAPKVAQALGQRLLQDPQSAVRYQAAVTLSRMGADSRYGLSGLIRGTTDTATWEIRQVCVGTLREAGRESIGGGPGPNGSNVAVPNAAAQRALVEALRDSTYEVRLEAVLALGTLARPSDRNLLAAIVKGLNERLNDRDPTVRVWAHIALMAVDEVTEKSLQNVTKLLKNKEVKSRVTAARGLGALGPKAKAAVPALIEALHDAEPEVVASAGWALAQVDELSGPARAALLDLIKDPRPMARAAAAQAFGAAGPKARFAVPPLAELAQDKTQPPFVVASACWAIGEIGDEAPAAETALNSVCQRKDVDDSLKYYAQVALVQIHKL